MQTWQASVFGFPNSYIGLIAFPALITIAAARLMGAVLPQVVVRLIHIAALAGVLFAYWLFIQSVFAIKVLCPWCLVVTFSATIIWESMTRYSILHNIWGLPATIQQKAKGWIAKDYDKLMLIAWLVAICIVVYWQFQDFL